MFADDRVPPQSLEAEMGVLGGVLRDNQVLSDILQNLRPENFYHDAHQKIFGIIIEAYNEGKPVDLVLLSEALQQKKLLEDVGGNDYLVQLWDAAPTAANTEFYAKIVREKAIIRNLIHVNTEILRDAYDSVVPAEELLGSAQRQILEIAEKGVTSETRSLADALNEAYDRIDA
ncbi:MAG: replicative DNA helicase, partial [Gemmataceae bacterium]